MDSFISIVSRRLATSPIPSGKKNMFVELFAPTRKPVQHVHIFDLVLVEFHGRNSERIAFCGKLVVLRRGFGLPFMDFVAEPILNKPVMAMLHKATRGEKKCHWWLITDHLHADNLLDKCKYPHFFLTSLASWCSLRSAKPAAKQLWTYHPCLQALPGFHSLPPSGSADRKFPKVLACHKSEDLYQHVCDLWSR